MRRETNHPYHFKVPRESNVLGLARNCAHQAPPQRHRPGRGASTYIPGVLDSNRYSCSKPPEPLHKYNAETLNRCVQIVNRRQQKRCIVEYIPTLSTEFQACLIRTTAVTYVHEGHDDP